MKRTAYRSRDSYAQVNWEMVKEVGGDITLAVVFDWITWKADPTYDGVEDQDGTAWYPASVAALAETMNVSEKVIRRALSELVRLGHLDVAELRISGAYDRTKSYRPVWESDQTKPAVDSTITPGTSADEGNSTCPTGQMGVALQGNSELPSGANVPLFETLRELTNKELFDAHEALAQLADLHEPALTPQQHFEIFWAIWPRGDGRKAALAKYLAALRRTTPGTILAAATAYAESPWRPERRFVPHAATWLHGDRWEDPPPAPPEQPHASPRLTNAEQALADYQAEYGDSHGHVPRNTPALDPGFGDRQPSGL